MSDAGRRPDDEPVTRGFCSGKMDPITSDLGQIKVEQKKHGEALFGVNEYGVQKGGLVNILGDVKRIVTEINEEGSKPMREMVMKFDKFETTIKQNSVQHKTRWQTYGVLIQWTLYAMALIAVAIISRK